eukprot:150882-Prorocentrum_minimum.AAC.2
MGHRSSSGGSSVGCSTGGLLIVGRLLSLPSSEPAKLAKSIINRTFFNVFGDEQSTTLWAVGTVRDIKCSFTTNRRAAQQHRDLAKELLFLGVQVDGVVPGVRP